MRSFEIFLGTYAESRDNPASVIRRTARRRVRELLDVFVDGANVTARIADGQASCVLRDLAMALTDLARAPRGKAIIRFYDEAWELAVERIGARAMLSVYRGGSDPRVAVYDRPVVFEEVIASVREAIAEAIGRSGLARAIEIELREADSALACIDPHAWGLEVEAPALHVTIEPDRDAPIAFGAEFAMRAAPESRADAHVIERSDLHALLFRGKIRAEVRGRVVEMGEGHPFLFAEELVTVARRALEAWERGRPFNVRREAGGAVFGVRVEGDGNAALTVCHATFPALAVPDVAFASLAFGRALVRAIVRRDRAQHGNLRLGGLRRALRETADHLREARQEDAKINPAPEAYRAFALASSGVNHSPPGAGGAPSAAPRREHAPSRLRFTTRWRAIVPQIDLRATFLCGDRLVVGAAQETFCLDRTTGEIRWRARTERATSVVTPGGIARLEPNGVLSLHDFGTGEVTMRTELAPRMGGPAAGAVVHVQGLPRLLIATSGERHLVAVDLASGEPRWRYAWAPRSASPRGGLRLKRSGKLLYIASGDGALTAIDVLTGAVVWRLRDRLRWKGAPTLDHDLLLATAGGVNSVARLYAVDAFSGRTRWSAAIDGGAPTTTVEGAPLAASGCVVVATRDRHGLRLVAHDRDSGAPRWASRASVAPAGTSWLAVDDLLLGNTPVGDLVAYSAQSGELAYRHVLGRSLESDTPRRLEPVLRSGALFVPHTDVHVFRPSDGALLGTIAPCDAIPDLLRVDERCDVYVAEESGHLACFAAGPRLVLVKS
jgi:outer membrane protein assembly factor BamB